MFTGLVRDIGVITDLRRSAAGAALTIEAPSLAGTAEGASVAVDGVCLTARACRGTRVTFDVVDETLGKTTLGGFRRGGRVNLEPSLKVGGELGGHFVTGHIDCAGKVVAFATTPRGWIEIDLPRDFMALVAPKGSIALDGVSLTVASVDGSRVAAALVPHTLASTTLREKSVGSALNVEFDILAKYVASSSRRAGRPLTESFLRDHGFL